MAHALVVILVFQTFPKARPIFEPQAISVELVAPPPPPPPEPPQPTPKPSKPLPTVSRVRKPDPPKAAAGAPPVRR